MSQPNGTRTVTCRYCGGKYQLNNFMKRERTGGHDDQGLRLTDTHLISCFRKMKEPPAKVNLDSARWGTDCWSKSGTAHLFDFVDGSSHELKAVCGRRRAMLNDMQGEEQSMRRCPSCLAVLAKGSPS